MIFVMALSCEENSKCSRLYREHKDYMYRRAYRILRDEKSAEDAVHDSFERILKYKCLLKIDESNYARTRNMLGFICNNVAKDIVKKRGKENLFSNDDILFERADSDNANPEKLLLSRETVSYIKDCIMKLPESYREAFLLKTVYDMHTEQIAGIMGEKTETIKKRITRTKEKLNSILPEEVRYAK